MTIPYQTMYNISRSMKWEINAQGKNSKLGTVFYYFIFVGFVIMKRNAGANYKPWFVLSILFPLFLLHHVFSIYL